MLFSGRAIALQEGDYGSIEGMKSGVTSRLCVRMVPEIEWLDFDLYIFGLFSKKSFQKYDPYLTIELLEFKLQIFGKIKFFK